MEIFESDTLPVPEATSEKEYTYPREYFDIQVSFAKKMLELSEADNLPSALLKFTSLYRRITDVKYDPEKQDERWTTIMENPDLDKKTTEVLWNAYTSNKNHEYSQKEFSDDEHHFGSYIYKDAIDKETGKQKIELHFNIRNRGRGKSDFSREHTNERIEDLKRLFSYVKNRMDNDTAFRPEFVTLGSWMNNLAGVEDTLPPTFVESGRILTPPNLSFNGDSLWGQFLTISGKINQGRQKDFAEAVSKSKNLSELLDSFPIKVVLFQAPINVFFKFFLADEETLDSQSS